MNFFGHATVARMRSEAPRFVLGAMLPDLVSMADARFAQVLDAELAQGVEHHHETDRAFHAVPAFRAACSSALQTLEPQGVSRGSARAVGHVGAELLLDGLWSSDARARGVYTRALDSAIEERAVRCIAWHSAADADRLHTLLVRLRAAPLPEALPRRRLRLRSPAHDPFAKTAPLAAAERRRAGARLARTTPRQSSRANPTRSSTPSAPRTTR